MRTFGDQIKPSTLSPASLDPLKSRLLSSLSTPLIKISSSLKQSAQPRRARATLATQHSADPGDTLKNARKIGVLKSDLFAANPFRRFRNSIGGAKNRKDKNDYYRFTLKNPSNFKLQLNGLSVNADVQIIRLDRKGNATRNPTPSQDPIQQAISDLTISPQGGIRTSKSRFINSAEIDLFRLPKGDYAVRVYTRSKQKTKYNLDLFATPSANGNFNIEFDYRFDTSGFFSDPARRATLEAAAFIWESWINDDFDDVPAGISYTILNPQAGSETPRITLTSPTDDLLIFVGAQSPPFGVTDGVSAAAWAGPNGSDAGGSIFSNRRDSDFEPWAGNISFEPSLSWFSDLTPSVWDDLSGADLLGTSLHEMGHVLGMGASGIFGQIGTNGFDGVNALKVNQNYPISLEPDLAHVKSGQMSVMAGSRLPTLIDLAILADIGYEIPGFTAQGSVRPIATQENETIFGTTLDDTIDGLGGNDTLQGQGGNDALSGGEGNDTLFGQEGNDALFGGEGDDFLGGGDGNDVLDGGAGNDLFSGDAGRDVFVFGAGSGQDNINGFVVSEDTIQLSAVAGYQIIQSGGTTGGGLFTRLAIGSNGDQVTVFHDLPLTTVNFSLV